MPPSVDSGYGSLSTDMTMPATPCNNSTECAPSIAVVMPSNSVMTPVDTPGNQKELSAQKNSNEGCSEPDTTDLCCKTAVSSGDDSAVKCEGKAEQQPQQPVAASTNVIEDDDDFKKPRKRLRSTGVSFCICVCVKDVITF